MKISSISYKNFRNFNGEHTIEFSTDGNVDIIYGLNGDGKTTFHQLCRWIFYGNVKFNKTSNYDILYNKIDYSRENDGAPIEVMGSIDFTHRGTKYTLKRTWTYTKGASNTKIDKRLKLSHRTKLLDWVDIDNENAQEKINQFLPESLSDYFFFEGEGMIEDFSKKGSDAAESLKEGIYYLFDLQLCANAVDHIGDEQRVSSMIGKLNSSRGETSNNREVWEWKERINSLSQTIENMKEEREKCEKQRNVNNKRLTELNEKIGKASSEEQLNQKRGILKKEIEENQLELKKSRINFGLQLSNAYSSILVAQRAITAKGILFSKKNNSKLPRGLGRELVQYLLESERCICGRVIEESEKKELESWLKVLPPNSYQLVYENYINKSKGYIKNAISYKQLVTDALQKIVDIDQAIEENQDEIDKIDRDLANHSVSEKYLKERSQLEENNKELEQKINENIREETTNGTLLKNYIKKQKKACENEENSKLIDKQIKILEELSDFYKDELKEKSAECRDILINNIKSYLDDILTTNKKVALSDKFVLTVADEFGDEYKSEGQFAVVSFCYILGILKTLSQINNEKLEKDYPLVLDGPFSKLDPVQRLSVIKHLPQVAPQVILMSKDSLFDSIEANKLGKVYCLYSNIDKNQSEFVLSNKESVEYYFSDERAEEEKRKRLNAREE